MGVDHTDHFKTCFLDSGGKAKLWVLKAGTASHPIRKRFSVRSLEEQEGCALRVERHCDISLLKERYTG